VFELKTIGVKQIVEQLRRIADAENIQADDAALMLIARAGDGSMRDAQSAFDQVIGFAGQTITADDVATVLGLVRRDLLIEIADAVARDDASAVFALAARAVESGYDLRLVVRELARMTRDLLVLTIDPSRVSDPEIAADAERQALLDLSRRFSGEDLMRAFDVLTKAEYDIKSSMQPRYHLEMALLRWIHLRKLIPLTDLIKQMEGSAPVGPTFRSGVQAAPAAAAPRPTAPAPSTPLSRTDTVKAVETKRAAAPVAGADAAPALKAVDPAMLKDSFLSEIHKAKKFFYGTVVAQAQRIEFEGDKVVFTFAPQHRALRAQLDQNRPWLESAATQLAGRRIAVAAAEGPPSVAVRSASSAAASSGETAPAMKTGDAGAGPVDRQEALKERALSDTGVQTMLDVFAAEIKDVEEM
jgi:DNA polymerase-3 subunit gamma/tau